MKKTNLFGALVLLVGIPLIAACDLINSSTSDSTDSNSTNTSQSSSSDSSSSSSSSDEQLGYYATFSHSFTQDDFPVSSNAIAEAGTTDEINGLVFDYTAAHYVGFPSGGMQIGSNNRPMTTPWELTTSLPEGTYVVGWSIVTSTNSGRRATASVEFGDYTYSETYTSYPDQKTISVSDIEVASDYFTLYLGGPETTGAVYLYELTIELYNENDVLGDITIDAIEPTDPVTPGEGSIPATKYEAIDLDTYYAGIDWSLTGDALEEELRTLISEMTSYSYGNDSYILLYTDEDLYYTGYVRGIWDGDLITASWGSNTWNKEHVWSQSHLNMDSAISDSYTGVASDLHNLRVSCEASNGYHSDKYYANENSSTYFDPSDLEGRIRGAHLYEGNSRGDAARILFYMAVRYDYLELSDDPDSNSSYSEGLLSVLLEWDRLDPVDDFEIQRNNRIYEYQGNRNPFIDYYDENLAEAIWG